jgi:hypothetical protein
MIVSAPLTGDIAKNFASQTKRDQATALVSKTCSDEPWMQAVRSHACPAQASSKFTRKQDVAKLGATISFDGSEIPHRLQIVKIQSYAPMRSGRGVNNARGSRRQ